MELNKEKSGTLAWAAIAGFVAIWDIRSQETLTHAFKRGLENPHSRYAVLGGLAITSAHLVGAIPKQIDPFYLLIDHTPLRELQIDKGDTIEWTE